MGIVEQSSRRSHVVCSLATPNHIDRLLVLGASLARHLPGTEFRALVVSDESNVAHYQSLIDAYLNDANAPATHSVLSLDNLDFQSFNPVIAAAIYDVIGFATSLKAPLMNHLLAEGWSRVTYLDSDIEVFADFTGLLDDSADVTVTPHILRDYPNDGYSPQAPDVLRSGFYNTGFLSVTPSGNDVVTWWANYLQFNSLAQVDQGHFHDQKVMDLVSTIGRVQELNEPGCNVAYWNLHERSVVPRENEWNVEFQESTSPLYFLHWSGFSLDRPGVLSRHCTRPIVGKSLPRLLVRRYEEALRHAAPSSPFPNVLVGAPVSTPLPSLFRHHLRRELMVHARAGRTMDEIMARFIPDRAALSVGALATHFVQAWAAHPAIDGVPNGISVFHRNDRSESVRHPYAQLEWATKNLATKFPGRSNVVTAVEESVAAQLRAPADIQIVGYLTYRAGIAQPPLAALSVLEEAGMSVALRRVSPGLGDDEKVWSDLLMRHNPLPSRFVAVLCFINFAFWRDHQQRLFPFASLPHESLSPVWAWELEEFPPVAREIVANSNFLSLHGISEWVATCMTSSFGCEVSAVTAFDVSTFTTTSAPLPSLPPRYVLATFDAKSMIGRKNPDALLDVWAEVSEGFPEVWLVVKSIDVHSLAPSSLLQKLDASPRTVVIDEVLSATEMQKLTAHCAAYISLHRSEGLGLGMLEAAVMGRPVVYTDYSGPSTLLDGDFCPVEFSMVPVGESGYDNGPYPSDAVWANPSHASAVQQLRAALRLSDQDYTKEVERLFGRIESLNEDVVRLAERLAALSRARHATELRFTFSRRVSQRFMTTYRRLPTPARRIVSRIRTR